MRLQNAVVVPFAAVITIREQPELMEVPHYDTSVP
ncbi:hypothetical protein PR003_g7829 [Phytophthora rubi]|uniref:Uncharacterized protein n=1 Tax=Phytophthora rubi TaxID=129364 RepID=A0A6A4FIU8_9STRA|nr:hypothetical protein PR003_g7829 [Phytophthora rubi]